MLLELADFLAALNEMYAEKKTVKIQMKNFAGVAAARKKRRTVTAAVTEFSCLVRAISGGKKISTEISKNKSVEFQNKLGSILRTNLAACLKQES